VVVVVTSLANTVVLTSLLLPRSSGPFEETDATRHITTAFREFYD
jgi:hypothetical protein